MAAIYKRCGLRASNNSMLTRASAKAAEAYSSVLPHAAEDCDMYAPTSASYKAQDPSGWKTSPKTFWELTGYEELSGVPQYEKREW